MNKTILSSKQSELIEKLILAHGSIVTSAQITESAKGIWDYKQTKNTITKLVKDGWLIRIKRGIYALSELASRGFLIQSSYLVANLLIKESYVSFQAALQYHNMFDQLLKRITSVSLRTYKTKQVSNMEYNFVKTKNSLFFGFEEVLVDNHVVRIATAEKALIDMVNFHKSKLVIDLVIEKIINHKQDLNFDRLVEHLAKFSIATIKTFGLIFDLLDIDSSKLYGFIKLKKSTHRMLAGDKKFNAKWRMYYDDFFDQYNTKNF